MYIVGFCLFILAMISDARNIIRKHTFKNVNAAEKPHQANATLYLIT